MSIYYNDSEPFVCAWLKNLIAAGHLPAGDVDERPIQEVTPDDVRGHTQAHFFAGIGGWPLALQLAGWGDRPVWTGSCPCQPFSAAGKRGSHADTRHLWPAWFDLIRECRPVTIFGEQVSGAAGLGWLDAVALDLETLDYAVGAGVLGAHSVGAPHLRQRLYFVADAAGCRAERLPTEGRQALADDSGGGETRLMADAQHTERGTEHQEHGEPHGRNGLGRSGEPCELGHPASARRTQAGRGESGEPSGRGRMSGERCRVDELANAERRPTERRGHDVGNTPGNAEGEAQQRERLRLNPWAGCEFIPCRDGKARPVEPGTFPLAHGVPARVGRLRAYGNAIVPQAAAAFVSAYLDCQP